MIFQGPREIVENRNRQLRGTLANMFARKRENAPAPLPVPLSNPIPIPTDPPIATTSASAFADYNSISFPFASELAIDIDPLDSLVAEQISVSLSMLSKKSLSNTQICHRHLKRIFKAF